VLVNCASCTTRKNCNDKDTLCGRIKRKVLIGRGTICMHSME